LPEPSGAADVGLREYRPGGTGEAAGNFRPALFTKGRVVFEQDSPLDYVFLITGGMVKLFRLLADGGRQVTGFLGPGDLLGGIKRSAGAYCTAQAIVDVTACVFPRAGFLRLLQEYPDLCFSLLITATDEIEAHNDHIILLGHRRVPQRLAAFLLVLGHRWKTNGADGRWCSFPWRAPTSPIISA
jgi:CRP/FNR family transcriptional regulator